MENNSKANLFFSNYVFKDVTLKQVKSPILNIFFGDFKLDIDKLAEMFSFRFADSGDVQWLNIKLDERETEANCKYGDCKYTFLLDDNLTIPGEFDKNFPFLINEICKKAKQRKYFEKSKLHINMILYAADTLYLYLELLIKKLRDSFKKAFINGMEVSLFCIYEEHFDIGLEESKKNLHFIETAYTVKKKYSNIITGIYFLSNYNNDEVYTDNCLITLLNHISIYIEMKSLYDRTNIKEVFSENKFIYTSELLNAEHKSVFEHNCCSIGVISLQKPEEYIKKIIEYNVILYYLMPIETKIRRALGRLNINSEMIPAQFDNIVSSLKGISCKKNNLQNGFVDVKTNIDKISVKYDIDSTKQKIKAKIKEHFQDYQKVRMDEFKSLLYSVVNDENLSVIDFYDLVNNGIIKNVTKAIDKYSKKYTHAQYKLTNWQQQKPLFSFQKKTLKRYMGHDFISVTDRILYMKWKKLYIEKEKYVVISEFYRILSEGFQSINHSTISAIETLNEKLQQIQDALCDISSSLNDFQIENTPEYYSELVKSVLPALSDVFPKSEVFDNAAFDHNTLENAAYKTIENIKVLSNEIYREHVANSNCLEEYDKRQKKTNSKQIFAKLLKEISKSNPISLRIIDNERINKQVFICLPYGSNIDKHFFSYAQENPSIENVSVVECTDRKSIDIVYINGNIDMNDILHF